MTPKEAKLELENQVVRLDLSGVIGISVLFEKIDDAENNGTELDNQTIGKILELKNRKEFRG